MHKTRKLNLGCGKKYLKNFTNLDYLPNIKKDISHNLNTIPYPFNDNSFDYIIADNVLEHLDDTVKVMEELHRIASNNATIEIVVPYFASYAAFNDPTHIRFFTYTTFDYFLENNPYNFYSKARFQILEKKLIFTSAAYGVIFKPISFLVNKFPLVYQKFFCFILPFNTLKVILRVIK